MDPLVFVLVAGAAVLHVSWNVLLKTAGDPLLAATVGMATATAVLCPVALVAWFAIGRPSIPSETVLLSIVSGFLEAIYFAFLVAAYRRGDLSLVYPLARGSAPLVAVAIGVVILGERLGWIGYAGVAALLVGLLALQRPWRYFQASGRTDGSAAGFALLTGLTIASYTAVDRVGVRGTEPWIYAALIWFSGTAFLALYAWIDRRRATPAPGEEAATFSYGRAGLGGLFTLAGYLMILVALSVAPLTAVAPLRESAVVLATGWGAIRLREASDRADVLRRIGSAGVILAGAVLLAID